MPPAARYCTSCGRAARPRTSRTPFLWAAIGLLAVTVPFAYWLGSERARPMAAVAGEGFAMTPAGGAGGPAMGSPPPLTGTLREQADRLFERVMRARASGNAQEAEFFSPMAISAYESLETHDADSRFHLALLLLSTGRLEEARQQAQLILDERPNHLLGLGAAASVATAAGDSAAARDLHIRYLEAYPNESSATLEEYRVHQNALQDYRGEAERLVGS